MRIDTVADPRTLCARLNDDLRDWNRFIADAKAAGEIGPDEQPLEPPPTPGTEPRLTVDATGVAAHCEKFAATFAKQGWKVVRQVVSQNDQYGVVWRADVTIPGYRQDPSRMVCWRKPGRSEYGIEDRPLEMFDASQSIPPLDD